MRRAGGGSIVNISSQLGLVGTDNSSPQYQASKGAVRLLTKTTAIQYARERIRANSVHPGPIVTAMTERRRADPEHYQLMLSRIPLGRFGEPDEVAYGVLYLASDESTFVTGSELVIDGGLDRPVGRSAASPGRVSPSVGRTPRSAAASRPQASSISRGA